MFGSKSRWSGTAIFVRPKRMQTAIIIVKFSPRYSSQAYGAEGVSKIIEILTKEIVIVMRLLGASSVDDLRPEMVFYHY